MFDMITMDIQIVPVIDNYITQFMSLDQFIPSMFTETTKLISEYLQKSLTVSIICNIEKLIINKLSICNTDIIKYLSILNNSL